MLPGNAVIQVATEPSELPPHIARQIGNMYLRRYKPNPAVEAIRGFKDGTWVGVLVWALAEDGTVLGWALKALPEGKKRHQVMLFVRKDSRRQGVGDQMLDTCRTWLPTEVPHYYPHDPTAEAFFEHRVKKLVSKKPLL